MKKIVGILLIVSSALSFSAGGSSYTDYRQSETSKLIEHSRSVETLYYKCLEKINSKNMNNEDIGINTEDFLNDLSAVITVDKFVAKNPEKAYFDFVDERLDTLEEKGNNYFNQLN